MGPSFPSPPADPPPGAPTDVPSPQDVVDAVNTLIDDASTGDGQPAPPYCMFVATPFGPVVIPSPRGMIDMTKDSVQVAVVVIDFAAGAGRQVQASLSGYNRNTEKRVTLAAEATAIALGRHLSHGSGVPLAIVTQLAVALGTGRPASVDLTPIVRRVIGVILDCETAMLRQRIDPRIIADLRSALIAAIAPAVHRARTLLQSDQNRAAAIVRAELLHHLRRHLPHHQHTRH